MVQLDWVMDITFPFETVQSEAKYFRQAQKAGAIESRRKRKNVQDSKLTVDHMKSAASFPTLIGKRLVIDCDLDNHEKKPGSGGGWSRSCIHPLRVTSLMKVPKLEGSRETLILCRASGLVQGGSLVGYSYLAGGSLPHPSRDR